jgi:hypothetical protein
MQIANKQFELQTMMNDPNLSEQERMAALNQFNLLGQAAKTYGFDRGVNYGMQPNTMMPQNPSQPPLQQGGQPQNLQQAPQTIGQMPTIAETQQPMGSQQQAPQVSYAPQPIAGYADAAASIAATKKAAETAAASDAKYEAEGRQSLPKMQRSLQSAELRGENIRRVADQVAQTAKRAFTTGFSGSIMDSIAGTPAYDLRNNLQTLEATAAFDTLQNMKDNSPTGGALGQVTERELDLLKAAYSNLANSQSYEQFTQNLNAFNRQNQQSLQNARLAYEQDYNRFGGAKDNNLPIPNQSTNQPVTNQPAPKLNKNADGSYNYGF